MSTKETILNAALALFNEFGTAKVSTNHIAEKAEISPGNLYYHFSNKEHIIRELHNVMIKDWIPVYLAIEKIDLSIESFEKFVLGHFKMLWKYRFYSRENVALIQNDRLLADAQFKINSERIARSKALMIEGETQGVFNFENDEKVIDDLLAIIWIISNQFLVHLESLGIPVNEKEFQNGVRLVLRAVSPYLVK